MTHCLNFCCIICPVICMRSLLGFWFLNLCFFEKFSIMKIQVNKLALVLIERHHMYTIFYLFINNCLLVYTCIWIVFMVYLIFCRCYCKASWYSTLPQTSFDHRSSWKLLLTSIWENKSTNTPESTEVEYNQCTESKWYILMLYVHCFID